MVQGLAMLYADAVHVKVRVMVRNTVPSPRAKVLKGNCVTSVVEEIIWTGIVVPQIVGLWVLGGVQMQVGEDGVAASEEE